jgi:thiamine-phosphate pyrophosphorylase
VAATVGVILEHADVAAVLLPLVAAADRTLVDRVKQFAPAVQAKGAALLIDGHPGLVVPAGADGAHLTGIDAFALALPTLRPERIAGCGGLATRHDAMLAAETGADYVMFGEPDARGHRPSLAAIVERVGWWAEVFEVPCVGYAASFDEIAPLAAAGADFVAIGPFVFEDSREPGAAIAQAVQQLAASETVA